MPEDRGHSIISLKKNKQGKRKKKKEVFGGGAGRYLPSLQRGKGGEIPDRKNLEGPKGKKKNSLSKKYQREGWARGQKASCVT